MSSIDSLFKYFETKGTRIKEYNIVLMSDRDKLALAKTKNSNGKIINKLEIEEEPDKLCSICNTNIRLCNANHMKYIKTSNSYLNPVYLSELYNILSIFCMSCSKPYIGQDIYNAKYIVEEDENSISKFINEVKKRQKSIKYCHTHRLDEEDNLVICGHDTYDGNTKIKIFLKPELINKYQFVYKFHTEKGEEDEYHEMKYSEIKNALKGIRNKGNIIGRETLHMLNIDPNLSIEDIITDILMVMPYRYRSNITISGNIKPNPFTIIYMRIFTLSSEGATSQDITKKVYELIYGGKTRTGATFEKTDNIVDKIKGKNSLLYGLAAQKTPTTGRAVLGSHNGDLDYVGIPKVFMESTPYPDEVRSDNIEDLEKLMKVGKIFGERPKNSIGGYFYRRRLNVGMNIYRQMKEQDYVMITRQPITNGGSIQISKIFPHKKYKNGKIIIDTSDGTFRIPVLLTSPLNADFDGDEANMIVPQTIESVNELSQKYYDISKIINSENGSVYISIANTVRLGVYLLLKKRNFSVSEFFRNISLISEPRPSSLQIYELFKIVKKDNIHYMDNNYTTLLSSVNNLRDDIIDKAIEHKTLKQKYFLFSDNIPIKKSIFLMNYYYDIKDISLIEYNINKYFNIVKNSVKLVDILNDINIIYDDTYNYPYTIYEGNIDENILNNININTKFKLLNLINDNFFKSLSKEYLNHNEKEINKDKKYYLHKDFEYNSDLKGFYILSNKLSKIFEEYIENIIPGTFLYSFSLPKLFDYYYGKQTIIKDGILIDKEYNDSMIKFLRSGIITYIVTQNYNKNSFIDVKAGYEFIIYLNRIVHRSYMYTNYTFSLSGLVGNLEDYVNYSEKINDIKFNELSLINYELNTLYNKFKDININQFKSKISEILVRRTNEIIKKLEPYMNSKKVDIYYKSGTKGKELNFKQMIYLIGLIYVSGNIEIYYNQLNKKKGFFDSTHISYCIYSFLDGYLLRNNLPMSRAATIAIYKRHSSIPTTGSANSSSKIYDNVTKSELNGNAIRDDGGTYYYLGKYGGDGLDNTKIIIDEKGDRFPVDMDLLANIIKK